MMAGLRRIFIFLAVLFMSVPVMIGQEKLTVLKGKVIDSYDGYPLIGVSVVVEGTRYGTSTDVDGNFEISVPDRK